MMTIGQHSSYILSEKELRTNVGKYAYVVIKQLTTLILNALKISRLAPGLAGWTPDNTIYTLIREVDLIYLPYVSLYQMMTRKVCFVCFPYSAIILIGQHDVEACLDKA